MHIVCTHRANIFSALLSYLYHPFIKLYYLIYNLGVWVFKYRFLNVAKLMLVNMLVLVCILYAVYYLFIFCDMS